MKGMPRWSRRPDWYLRVAAALHSSFEVTSADLELGPERVVIRDPEGHLGLRELWVAMRHEVKRARMFGVGQRLQQLRPSGSGEPGNLVIEVLGLIVVKIVRGMSFNSAGGSSPVETNALNSGLPRRSRLKSPSTIRLVFQSDLRLAQASIHSLLDAHDAIVRVQL